MESKVKFPWPYLALAYALAWSFWIPLALIGQEYQSSPFLVLLILLGVFGPGAAGIIMTYREQGTSGRSDFWQRAFDFRRIRPVWYGMILVALPSLHLLAIAINGWAGGSAPHFEFISRTAAQPLGVPLVISLYLIQAGLEELGWRGYMLERVQAIWGPLNASLVVGASHAFWHLPLFWVVGTNQFKTGFGIDFALFIATGVAASLWFTWCYNANRRSTLAVILLHTVGNLSLDTFMLLDFGSRIYSLLFVASAVALGAFWATRPQERMLRQSQVHIGTD